MEDCGQTVRARRLDRLMSCVVSVIFGAFFAFGSIAAPAQDVNFKFDPQHTAINFTLGDVLHTVHGTFLLERGSLTLDPLTAKLSGEIVVNARSGQSGNGMRDRKMQKEVLESDRYSEIAFRPDHLEGTLALQGKSSVQVHGAFSIHGAEHELSAPAEVEIFPDGWRATMRFEVPYAKWGMKNPSTLFLKVSESVDIDLSAAGTLTRP